MKSTSTQSTCICKAGRDFVDCCDPFLNQGKIAETPEQLMRSRYAAYALGGYGEYLLSTWLPENSQGLDALSLSVRSIKWTGLEVISHSEKGDLGWVEFKASYIGEQGVFGVHHEKSTFLRQLGKWLYVSGEII